jgi:hypothetical protein
MFREKGLERWSRWRTTQVDARQELLANAWFESNGKVQTMKKDGFKEQDMDCCAGRREPDCARHSRKSQLSEGDHQQIKGSARSALWRAAESPPQRTRLHPYYVTSVAQELENYYVLVVYGGGTGCGFTL